MPDGKIYVIRNDINDRVYVGQTIRDLKERFGEHCYNSHRDRGYLTQAIEEYGREHFWIELLEDGLETQRDLNYREAYYISTLRTVWPDGYNITTGGTWNHEFKSTKTPPRQEFVDAYNAGYSLMEIAEKFGVCNTTVWNHLKKAGVQTRNCGSAPGECNRWEHTKRKHRDLPDTFSAREDE